MEPWLFYALLSAVSAAFVSIFGKVGLQGIDSNVATAVRAVIMAVFLIGVVFVQGNFSHLADVLQDKKGLLFVALSGIAGATSWLFYFLALNQVRPRLQSRTDRQAQRRLRRHPRHHPVRRESQPRPRLRHRDDRGRRTDTGHLVNFIPLDCGLSMRGCRHPRKGCGR